jgi:hypothetical protein
MENNSLHSVSSHRQATLSAAIAATPSVSVHKTIKRFFGISLACLCLATQAWGDPFTVNGINYTITSENTVAVTGGGEALTEIAIPATVTYSAKDYNVTSIGDNAFRECASLTSIVIPTSVTTIGGDAFHSCSSLASITTLESVTSIGDGAFAYCSSLTSITIPG